MSFDIKNATPVKKTGFDIKNATPVNNPDVPASGTGPAFPAIPKQPDSTFGEKLYGAGEAALAVGTGIVRGAPAFLTGSLEGVAKELTGEIETGEGLDIAQQRASSVTFQPKTKVGNNIVKFISEKLGVLPPISGLSTVGGGVNALSAASKATGGADALSTTIKAQIPKIPKSKARQIRGVLSDEIKAGNVNAGNIAKTLDSDGSLINNPRTKSAIKLLGDGDAAYGMAINFEKMNTATRAEVNKVLNSVQANKLSGDPKFINKNRPANVIGASIAKSASRLNDVKKGSSRLLGSIMEQQDGNKTVNIASARDDFIAALNRSDISITKNEQGNLIADTTKTLTNIDEVIKGNKLNNVLARVQAGKMSAREAHKIKRNIRELVDYNPSSPGSVKVSVEIENAIKKLSSDLGDSVSAVSKPYEKQNKIFSQSIEALKKADKSLGNSLMIGDELAEAKFGALSKRIATNLASKEQVLDMVNSLEEALGAQGKASNVDIERLVQTVADIEDIFKLEPQQARFGFQSRIAKGVLDTATTGAPAELLARGAIDAAANMSKLDFNDKMKALRILAKINKENK
tara:strand:- start:855 stop:2579 length:1725 start_codon:yes stop_codon:yes gene_type:complete